ncbi:hypothetical protein L2E82_20685 [Cichorium intybus]|uniref:Uncharacterized protein n=1 Tax=Cichorium intybus TaxID=13427 RepID=A0ACB9DUC3_CICIN|nr:hypothetical protein L2E82_20685 [Cichorium intybus]
MTPTLSRPKPMISMCNYTTASNYSPRYATRSACIVFKESRSGSSLDWFHASPTSSENEFMISANKIKDVGGCGADKWLSASEVNPKQLDMVETSCREGVCREMMKVAYE